jgi:hypothetical protein
MLSLAIQFSNLPIVSQAAVAGMHVLSKSQKKSPADKLAIGGQFKVFSKTG